jgi:hypothetical protein
MEKTWAAAALQSELLLSAPRFLVELLRQDAWAQSSGSHGARPSQMKTGLSAESPSASRSRRIAPLMP